MQYQELINFVTNNLTEDNARGILYVVITYLAELQANETDEPTRQIREDYITRIIDMFPSCIDEKTIYGTDREIYQEVVDAILYLYNRRKNNNDKAILFKSLQYVLQGLEEQSQDNAITEEEENLYMTIDEKIELTRIKLNIEKRKKEQQEQDKIKKLMNEVDRM